MVEKTDRKVPGIRFKGFDGEWNTTTLGKLGSVETNKRIFMHDTAPTGDVPFYKIGTFGREPKLFVSQSLFDTYKERFPFPEKGDLLFSVIGSIGRVVEYEGEDEYFQDSNIVWLKHNGAIDNTFLKQFYSIVEWSGLEGSTIKHLYNRNILATEITLPCQSEQTQIGAYFKSLDRMIGLHQRKHDKLVTLKQAMLQKMFPQDGATTPEIRFGSYKGEWVANCLGNLIQLENGYAFKSKFFSDKQTNTIVLTPGSVKIGGGFQGGKGRFYTGQVETDKFVFEAGDIFVTMTDLTPTSQALGYPARVPDDGVTYLHNQRLGKLTDFDGDEEFLLNLLCTDSFHRFIVSTASGTTVKHTSPEKILSFEGYFPSKPEQKRIGTYFLNLDTLISKHATQLSKLKNIKSACLEKMFV